MRKIKVGLMGLGTVGSGVMQIIEENQRHLQQQIGCPIEVSRVLVRDMKKKRDIVTPHDKLTTNPADIINDPDIHLIVEVIGGVELTKEYLLQAIENGKHIVTANKNLMGTYGVEILRKAKEHGCDVFYEASVGGGIPIIRPLVESFAADRVHKIMGIVNGTTNFILSKLSKDSETFEVVLEEAQKLGYAESDPTDDIEGIDSAYKISILGSLGFQTNLTISDVCSQGISNITKRDVWYGKKLDCEIKLLAIAERDANGISLSVEPVMIHQNHPLASVNGVNNAICVYSDAVGETIFYGQGAGSLPTAHSVVGDIVAVAKNMNQGVSGRSLPETHEEKRIKSDDEIYEKYFILIEANNGNSSISNIISSLDGIFDTIECFDKSIDENACNEIMIKTQLISKSNLNKVLRKIEELSVVEKVASVYRMEGISA
ncbi:MAG: homoserine dehydrogenase [Bacillales bacterium]|jgi:homoserine dehydrogenase|nr:homoserine dehydrogenase [Bacillales bacterium]